jgi:hypothetical protein
MGSPTWEPCHTQEKDLEGDIGCVVPLHKELAIGTLLGILKQAKLSVEECLES